MRFCEQHDFDVDDKKYTHNAKNKNVDNDST